MNDFEPETLVIAATITQSRQLASKMGLNEAICVAYDTRMDRAIRGMRIGAVVFDDVGRALRAMPEGALETIQTCQLF